MTLSQLTVKSDWIGMFVSGLCLVHCLATPFIFLAYVNVGTHGEAHPFWWGLLDIVFLVFSFFAVYWSARNTSKAWVKYAFGFLWVVLSLVILNEKLELFHLPEAVIYPPTLGLIILHFYNRRYCNCNDETCCADV
ncbi:MerC domain-containing protein [Flagellimonas sp. HMM57]|uniref:MerC domain-containing protein n=1 Tax=unclassified Flagellimonas TaxID=2644544 RepID=UPI001F0B15ED|nr:MULTISPECIES: MerC domain-containing protein [unclassified Flagellimonas]UII76218.1 MerC domain-containing protein [Flagellimonas sp. HMM57]